MKKFISMVMAAAMVVSLVPATAFAASVESASAKVVDVWEVTVADAETVIADGNITGWYAPELQLTLNGVDAQAGEQESIDFTLELENAKVATAIAANAPVGKVTRPNANNEEIGTVYAKEAVAVGAEKIKVYIKETDAKANFRNGDMISIEMTGLTFEKTKVGTKATVEATGKVKSDEVVFAAIVEKGIKVELDDEVVKVAADEDVVLEDIVITPAAGYDFKDVLTTDKETGNYYITLKLNNGFEFIDNVGAKNDAGEDVGLLVNGRVWADEWFNFDEDELTMYFTDATAKKDEIRVSNIAVWAPEDAKDGEVCTMTVKSLKVDSVKVEVAKIVDMKVVMELVDPDEDVPTFYNGVNVDNTGLNVTDDHKALEVKIYETFAGAWSNHKDWTLTLPEGVHVVGLTAVDETTGDLFCDDIDALFETAYQNGDHEYFKFKKGSFNESHDGDDAEEAHEISFVMTLVADPDFVGDVTLKLEGALLDTQEVTIAKVLAPYTVKAEQNDVIIDYRYTEVPTAIVITEAEPNLWDKKLTVSFAVEDMDVIKFEDNAVVSVNEESEMEITAIEKGEKGLGFTVDARSEDEAAVITIDGIELFMQRNIPAGAYSLDVLTNTATAEFEKVVLFAPDCSPLCTPDEDGECPVSGHECRVADVADYSTTVHESWINVVTAGRDQDDASFTTKIVVPVGETTMYAGEKAITLDVPAYINANDYVMLPVRAVATALGIDNNAVQWDQATKTVIIMYGQRIITMTAGQSVVYVSGTAIPAKAAVEIVDGRAFLGLRDLATTLGISAINYDATTKTATLN